MCGIAGWLGKKPAGAPEEKLVQAMLQTMRHRGPDGFGCETVGRAVLGHARLAIIDLNTGDQPQSDASRKFHVICNGEIYNYKELRRDLELRGHVFRTQSDIEVIPHLYAEKGDACVDDLRGMFSFALYDENEDRMLLARDRLGKKPLYYAHTDEGFAFGSELRVLGPVPGIDHSPDREAVEHFLTWQYVPCPWSIKKGIRKLEAASVMSIDREGRVQTRKYWDPLPEPEEDMTETQALDAIDRTLREASDIRLRSDVPLATFLSGGIDSGLVVSYLAEATTQPLSGITVGFPGAEEDETELTRATAQALGVELHEVTADSDLLSVVNQVLHHLDEPHGDSSCVPTWMVSKAAAQRVKVVISGDGGDESFGGYSTRYRQCLALTKLRKILPGVLRKPLGGGLAQIWPKADRWPRPLRLKNVLESWSMEFEDAYAQDMSIFRPAWKKRFFRPEHTKALGDFSAFDLVKAPLQRTRSADPLSRLLYADRHTYLSEGVIAKVDRMSMAHSLEVRSPLLDQEIVSLAHRIPSHLKLKEDKGKYVLRQLAKRRLPDSVTSAKKKGFAPPLAHWMRGPLAELVRERVSSKNALCAEYLDPAGVDTMLREHVEGRQNFSRPLWLLLVLETWAGHTQSSPSTASPRT